MDPRLSFMAEDWLKALLAETEKEAKEDLDWRIILLQSKARTLAWEFCVTFGVNHRGIASMSCRLMEKYLAIEFRQRSQESVTNGPPAVADREFKEVMLKRFCLALVSCVQLAAKMNSVTIVISFAAVTAALRKLGFEHSEDDIKQSEYQVFKTIGFSVPVWSTIETSEFLAKLVGLNDKYLITFVGMLTDIGEFNRDRIDATIKRWHEQNDSASSSSSSSQGSCNTKIRNIHLCAGAIIAGVNYVADWKQECSARLATLTRTSAPYLLAISDAIFEHIYTTPSCVTTRIRPVERIREDTA